MTKLHPPQLGALLLALASIFLFPGCSSWTENWKRMRERQDAAARATVDTNAGNRSSADDEFGATGSPSDQSNESEAPVTPPR
jgi:hypothetical protein